MEAEGDMKIVDWTARSPSAAKCPWGDPAPRPLYETVASGSAFPPGYCRRARSMGEVRAIELSFHEFIGSKG
jgi:hypothetical protein